MEVVPTRNVGCYNQAAPQLIMAAFAVIEREVLRNSAVLWKKSTQALLTGKQRGTQRFRLTKPLPMPMVHVCIFRHRHEYILQFLTCTQRMKQADSTKSSQQASNLALPYTIKRSKTSLTPTSTDAIYSTIMSHVHDDQDTLGTGKDDSWPYRLSHWTTDRQALICEIMTTCIHLRRPAIDSAQKLALDKHEQTQALYLNIRNSRL